ncbi:hypothetical protein ACFL67_04550 [candidate division KSB1 bacterium]
MLYLLIYKKIALITLCLLLTNISCGLLSRQQQAPRRNTGPVQPIAKQFSDGSYYYVVRALPSYFPHDIPVAESGKVEKMYVYGERDMDLIISSQESASSILSFYRKNFAAGGWSIERDITDSKASLREMEIKLSFREFTVDILTIPAENGFIISAAKGPIVIVNRIISSANSQNTVIIQQIRVIR